MILASVSSLTGPSREFTRDSYRTGYSGLGAGAAQWKGTARKNWMGADSASVADYAMCAGRPQAGPSLARVPRTPFVPRSSASRSFARARAARSLRMTSRGRLEKRKKGWRSSWEAWLLEPAICQVFPGRVVLFEQAHLPCTTPTFDLLFPGNRVTNVRELLKVDQPSDVVRSRKAGGEAALVLIHPPDDVVRDAH